MSHCYYYGDNYRDCRDYPTYCNPMCPMYQLVSSAEMGKGLKALCENIKKERMEKSCEAVD